MTEGRVPDQREMREEVESTGAAPPVGMMTKSQATGGASGAMLGGIGGALLGVLIGALLGGGGLMLITMIAFAVAGTVAGAVLGGYSRSSKATSPRDPADT